MGHVGYQLKTHELKSCVRSLSFRRIFVNYGCVSRSLLKNNRFRAFSLENVKIFTAASKEILSTIIKPIKVINSRELMHQRDLMFTLQFLTFIAI